jgi:galactonate dehydratase
MNKLSRRDLFRAAIAAPVISLPALEAATEPARGALKITAIKALQLKSGATLLRIETDGGISGYGECPGPASSARAAIAALEGPRLPHLGLIGKDPLAIGVLHHNMFYAYPQRGRHTKVWSGIDMALWDLAGKALGQPVSRLLGGNFRDEILLYSHCSGGDFLSAAEWRDRAARLKAEPRGFTAYKVDIHHALGWNMQESGTSIGPKDADKVRRAYAMAREAIDPSIDIIVHCHCELDTASAIRVAEAVEPIKPLFLEDPVAPGFSESWMALRRSSRIPLMTGENIELAEQALPFLQNQAVDILQPDIVNCGGITAAKRIADLAALYRTPVAFHNVSGILLDMASQQVAAAVFDCPRIESIRNADQKPWAKPNPLVIRNGKVKVSTAPGLGVEIDQDWLKANRADGEPWWG